MNSNKYTSILKSFILIFSAFVLIISCKDQPPVITLPALEGGKGGDFSVAIFTKQNGVGKDSRIFLKYAANQHPGDTALFDERSNTMTEPGYGPHAHFSLLTKGTYYLYCQSKDNMKVDSVLVLEENSVKSRNIYLNLK